MNDIDKYLKIIRKGLRGPIKEKKRLLADLQIDIEKNCDEPVDFNKIITKIGDTKVIINEFNQSYDGYSRQLLYRRMVVFSIIIGITSFILGALGYIGKQLYINSEYVSTVGGVDKPIEVITQFEPYTLFDLFNLFTNVSKPLCLLFVLIIIITLFIRRKNRL